MIKKSVWFSSSLALFLVIFGFLVLVSAFSYSKGRLFGRDWLEYKIRFRLWKKITGSSARTIEYCFFIYCPDEMKEINYKEKGIDWGSGLRVGKAFYPFPKNSKKYNLFIFGLDKKIYCYKIDLPAKSLISYFDEEYKKESRSISKILEKVLPFHQFKKLKNSGIIR